MKINPAWLRRYICYALAGALFPGLMGCETARDYSLTYKLWNNGEMRRFYEPAQNARLELFHDPAHADVLAAYDEAHETRSAIRRRAYLVNQNRSRVEAGRKPEFIKPESAIGLRPIPLLAAVSRGPITNAIVQAMVATNGQGFTLNGDAFGGQTYQLPVYQDQTGLAGRVLLSPLAVTGDAVMVGLVTGVVAVWLYAQAHTGSCGMWP